MSQNSVQVTNNYPDNTHLIPTPPTPNIYKAPHARELTIHCTSCNCPSLVSLTFPLSLTFPSANHPITLVCPIHKRLSITTQTDGYDSYAASLAMPKAATIRTMIEAKNILKQAAVKYTKHRNPQLSGSKYTEKPNPYNTSNLNFLDTIMQAMPNYGTTTLNCACPTCKQVFTLTISNKQQPNPPIYCPFCHAPNLTLVPAPLTSTYAFDILAEKYNIHPWYCESLYTLWITSHQNYETFDSFMQALPTIFAKELPTKTQNTD